MEQMKDLELLVVSGRPLIAVETVEEERLEEALQVLAGRLERTLHTWTVTDGLRRSAAPGAVYDTRTPGQALAAAASLKGPALFFFKDLPRHLGEATVVRRLLDLSRGFVRSDRTLVFDAPHLELPDELERVTAVFRLDLPTAQELKLAARRLLRDLSREHRIKVQLSDADFDRLIDGLRGLTRFEAERALTEAVLTDLQLCLKDLDHVIQAKKKLLDQEGLLEYTPPEEGLSHVGGLGQLKAWLHKRKRAFTREAKRFGLTPPKGILLLGVQGCGKSLAAKSIAAEWGLPLLRLETGRLFDKYVGETEKRLERALQVAERMAPAVLMVDEIEKALASGGDSSADAGLSRRVLGRLLGWLQDREAPVFVVATCNAVTELPPELMRKGRIDEIFFVDLPRPEERREIFEIHLRARERDPGTFDLDRLADASDGFSGSEIEQAVVSALYSAFAQETELDTAFILEELATTRPLSVTRREEVESLRAWARGRTVLAS